MTLKQHGLSLNKRINSGKPFKRKHTYIMYILIYKHSYKVSIQYIYAHFSIYQSLDNLSTYSINHSLYIILYSYLSVSGSRSLPLIAFLFVLSFSHAHTLVRPYSNIRSVILFFTHLFVRSYSRIH